MIIPKLDTLSLTVILQIERMVSVTDTISHLGVNHVMSSANWLMSSSFSAIEMPFKFI